MIFFADIHQCADGKLGGTFPNTMNGTFPADEDGFGLNYLVVYVVVVAVRPETRDMIDATAHFSQVLPVFVGNKNFCQITDWQCRAAIYS